MTRKHYKMIADGLVHFYYDMKRLHPGMALQLLELPTTRMAEQCQLENPRFSPSKFVTFIKKQL